MFRLPGDTSCWYRLPERRTHLCREAEQTGQRPGAAARHQSCRPQTLHTGSAHAAGTTAFAEPVLNVDRKSTPLNSSHTVNSYARFCLEKKKKCTRARW